MDTQNSVQEIKLVSIGNSKGVRLPKPLLQKYAISNPLILEETPEGILLRSKDDSKLSWESSYKQMAEEQERAIFGPIHTIWLQRTERK